jgi:hypothetical protein
MSSCEIAHATKVAAEGEIAALRKLREYLITFDKSVSTDILSPRQRKIPKLVDEA